MLGFGCHLRPYSSAVFVHLSFVFMVNQAENLARHDGAYGSPAWKPTRSESCALRRTFAPIKKSKPLLFCSAQHIYFSQHRREPARRKRDHRTTSLRLVSCVESHIFFPTSRPN